MTLLSIPVIDILILQYSCCRYSKIYASFMFIFTLKQGSYVCQWSRSVPREKEQGMAFLISSHFRPKPLCDLAQPATLALSQVLVSDYLMGTKNTGTKEKQSRNNSAKIKQSPGSSSSPCHWPNSTSNLIYKFREFCKN